MYSPPNNNLSFIYPMKFPDITIVLYVSVSGPGMTLNNLKKKKSKHPETYCGGPTITLLSGFNEAIATLRRIKKLWDETKKGTKICTNQDQRPYKKPWTPQLHIWYTCQSFPSIFFFFCKGITLELQNWELENKSVYFSFHFRFNYIYICNMHMDSSKCHWNKRWSDHWLNPCQTDLKFHFKQEARDLETKSVGSNLGSGT